MQSNTFSGLFIGQNVITLQEVDSTNEYLKLELTKSTPLAEGTVIMAAHQKAGKGQLGTTWQTEPGKNLTISLLLTPTFLQPQHQFRLTVAISLAVVRWLQSLASETTVKYAPIKVKWPNDIYVGDKKIAGILIENIIKGKTWKSAITGIGVNLNQTDFPENFRARTTSLLQVIQKETAIPAALSGLCKHIQEEYILLKEGNFTKQLARYSETLFRLGEPTQFCIDGVKVTGVLQGVAETGRMLVNFKGHIVDFDIKEIAFVI